MRIVFMGTPAFAVGTLQRLIEEGYNVVGVITQRDKPVGRHALLRSSAVKEYALEKGIPVMEPASLKDESFLKELASYEADVQVVVAFRMLPKEVWSMARWGTFNIHASLLPQYRGAAPINWAIINGEEETGVTSFFIDEQIDTGCIIGQKRCPIPQDATYGEMHDRLMVLGAELAVETLEELIENEGRCSTIVQDDSLSTKGAPKLFNDNCEIDWQQSAKRVYDFIRGLSPTPGAWTTLRFSKGAEPQTVKIYAAHKTEEKCSEEPGSVVVERKRLLVSTQDFYLELTDLQLAGRKRMRAIDVINGLRL